MYVRQRRSYGRLCTGIGKSVCYVALPFIGDFRAMNASDFYLFGHRYYTLQNRKV